jgi:NAD(P)-dependent dehydrogenase (short-subunit alcohol dehydrogenase family)
MSDCERFFILRAAAGNQADLFELDGIGPLARRPGWRPALAGAAFGSMIVLPSRNAARLLLLRRRLDSSYPGVVRRRGDGIRETVMKNNFVSKNVVKNNAVKKKVALITGASSGIGQATAERLAEAGYEVFGTSRRAGPAGQRSFEMLTLDVTIDQSVQDTVQEVMHRAGRIDVLVNNAGFGVAPAGAEESSIEQAQSIFDTNFFGIVRMTRAIVPRMRQQGGGRIINIGSVLGFLPMPYGALYAATKHAIEGYSESLDHELRTRGIRVSVIEPAYTMTPFDANFLEPDATLDEYREIRAALNERVKEVMASADQPRVVADVVLRAARAARPKIRYTAGGLAGRLRFLRTFMPAGMVDAGIRKDLRLDASMARLGLKQ